jgi:LacI family transcriptional regulator
MPEKSPVQPAGLRDVARRAGVSTATVSRVLTGTAVVSDAKRRAVEKACDALGYVLNGAARALSSRRSMTIGAVVPTIETPTFAVPLTLFQRRVHDMGYTLLLANSGFDPRTELAEVTTLLEHGVDALMVVGNRHDPAMWRRIERKSIPCVQTWSLDADRPSVGFDNRAVGRAMADYLMRLGHTRLAVIIGSPPSNDRGSRRVAGIRERLAEEGLELRPEWLFDAAFSLGEGRTAATALLERAERPTAMICGTDLLAFGALQAALTKRVRVPGELSVMGFNDYDYAAHLSPPLTTIRVALGQMGVYAADSLLAELAGRPSVFQARVDTELVVRDSTGPAPA